MSNRNVTLSSFDTTTTPRLFATIGSDNRLRLWDVVTGELKLQHFEKDHLATQYTSIAFRPPPAAKKKGKKEAKEAKMDTTGGTVAVGTSKGAVLLWNLRMGVIDNTLKGHSQQITSLAFSHHGFLFSASEDKQLIQWNLSNGEATRTFTEKHAISRICLSGDASQILSASSSIRLRDLSSGKIMKKFSGHSTAVTCLAFSHDQKFFLSGSNDRVLSLWSVSAEDEKIQKKKGDKVATHTFTLESDPVAVQWSPHLKSETSGIYEILVLSSRSVVSVWEWNSKTNATRGEKTSHTLKPDVTIQLPQEAKAESGTKGGPKYGITEAVDKKIRTSMNDTDKITIGIIAAAFSSSSEITLVQAPEATGASPTFQVVAYKEEDEKFKASPILLEKVSTKLFQKQKKKKNATSENSDEKGQDETPKTDGDEAGAKTDQYQSSGGISPHTLSVLPPTSAYPFELSSDDEEEVADETKKKTKQKRKKIEGEVVAKILSERLAEQEQASKKKKVEAIPKMGTVHIVLAQAIQTNDDTLVEHCFEVCGDNQEKIRNTIEKLKLSFVVPLLTIMVNKLTSHPSRALIFISWINQILHVHTAYLLSQADQISSGPIAALHATIQARTSTFNKLLRLAGRLDLLVSHAAQKKEQQEKEEHPLMVFNEK